VFWAFPEHKTTREEEEGEDENENENEDEDENIVMIRSVRP